MCGLTNPSSASRVKLNSVKFGYGRFRTEDSLMYETGSTRPELPAEAAQRLTRLSEEIRARLLEVALIAAHATKTDLPNSSTIRFSPRPIAADADAGAGDWMEIIEVEADDGQVYEACYGVINGVPFAESPCGG